MICFTHTLTHSHRLYLFVEECKWVCWKSGRAWIWNEKKVLLCKISLLLLLLLYGKMKIYAPTFYIINWQWVYVFVFMCVCTQLNSTRLDATQLNWHMKAQPFRFRMRGIRYSNSQARRHTHDGRKGGTGGQRWATSTRPPFPRGLKLIITFFTHNFTLHWCVTWGDVLMGGTSYSTGSM